MRARAFIAVGIPILLASVSAAYAASMSVTSQHLSTQMIALSTVTLTSDADTYVDQQNPDSNFGTQTDMAVQSRNSSRNQRVYIHFDLSSIPSGAHVVSATLRLVPRSSVSGRTYEIDAANASWAETTITWNNQPATAAATDTTASGANPMIWDVTTDAQTFVTSSSTNHGWQIRDSAENSSSTQRSRFYTREEATASRWPQLVVEYQ